MFNRNEILLISSIHYVTKLDVQTQSVLSGDHWDSREGKNVSSSVVTWIEVCLAITTLMLYAALDFGKDYWFFFELLKGIMPQNLPEQMLQRIVRLSANGNSQREVARMLGVSQGWISKILRRNRETGRPHQRKRGDSTKISMPWEDRQLLRMVRTNRFISAPRLGMQMIRQFGRRMSVWTIRRRLLVAGYLSRCPARCPRLTLEHSRRRREWGRRHNVWDLRQWRHCIFSDASRFSL